MSFRSEARGVSKCSSMIGYDQAMGVDVSDCQTITKYCELFYCA